MFLNNKYVRHFLGVDKKERNKVKTIETKINYEDMSLEEICKNNNDVLKKLAAEFELGQFQDMFQYINSEFYMGSSMLACEFMSYYEICYDTRKQDVSWGTISKLASLTEIETRVLCKIICKLRDKQEYYDDYDLEDELRAIGIDC